MIKKPRTKDVGPALLDAKAGSSCVSIATSAAPDFTGDFVSASHTAVPNGQGALSRNFSDTDPDSHLSKILVEVYFTKYFVSGLHIDRERLTLELQAGTLPRYVLYSVFALASR